MRSALFISPEAPVPAGGRRSSAQRVATEFPGARLCGGSDHLPRAASGRSASPSAGLAWCNDLHVVDLPAHARHPLARAARNAGRLGAARSTACRSFRRLRRPNRRGNPRAALRTRGHRALLVRALLGTGRRRQRCHDTRPAQHRIGAARALRAAGRRRTGRLRTSGVSEILPQFGRETGCLDSPICWRLRNLMRTYCAQFRQARTYWFTRIRYRSCRRPSGAKRMSSSFPAISSIIRMSPPCATFGMRSGPQLRAQWPGLMWRLIGKNPHAVAKIVSGDPRIELSARSRTHFRNWRAPRWL